MSKTDIILPDSIGKMDAKEDYQLLEDCHVKSKSLDYLLDIDNSFMVVVGRTGSGKTALAKIMENSEKHVQFFELSQLTLRYVLDNELIKYLKKNHNLNTCFEILWKHVLCISIIHDLFDVRDSSDSVDFFKKIQDWVNKNGKKREILDYLKSYQDKFWLPIGETIKDFFQRTLASQNPELQFGANYSGINTQFKNQSTQQTNKMARESEYVNTSPIDTVMIRKLEELIDLICDYLDENQIAYRNKKRYIIIDNTDENFIENEEIRLSLLGALYKTIRKKQFNELRKKGRVKIITTLRTDVLEKIIEIHSPQTDKDQDYIRNINKDWNKNLLKDLINKRIDHLCSKKHSKKSSVYFDDIFPKEVNGEDSFDYIINRSFRRPRDLISFVNECLRVAAGSEKITESDVIDAEKSYSKERFQALISEWKNNFPYIKEMLSPLRGKIFKNADYFSSNEFVTEVENNIVMKGSKFGDLGVSNDKFCRIITVNGNKNNNEIAAMYIEILYMLGVFGIKESNNEFEFTHIDDYEYDIDHSRLDTYEVCIHPMFNKALRVG